MGSPKVSKAITVGIVDKFEKLTDLESSLAELSRLLETLGIETLGRVIQHKAAKSPQYKIGKGKLEELRETLYETRADLVVFDGDLTPGQARNIQKELRVPVSDRTGIILDIFSQHARSRESKLQIELARLEYSYSRLKRKWTHLHRQRGGYGSSFGEGETQLEVDRRITKSKIGQVRAKLEKIRKQREVRKKQRSNFFQVAIVGYTNSGKSTLLNCMTESTALVQDKLFATLDPTTRIIRPEEKPAILFSDTVGFIRKLPHHLVASFRSTFEQIHDSDLLLHVVDVSDPQYQQRILDTIEVLKELGLDEFPRMLILNKADRIGGIRDVKSKMIRSIYPGSVLISARTKSGLTDLKAKIYNFFLSKMSEGSIRIAFGGERFLRDIYELTRVLETSFEEDSIHLRFRGATRDVDYLIEQLRQNHVLLQMDCSPADPQGTRDSL
jgi:GTPase